MLNSLLIFILIRFLKREVRIFKLRLLITKAKCIIKVINISRDLSLNLEFDIIFFYDNRIRIAILVLILRRNLFEFFSNIFLLN